MSNSSHSWRSKPVEIQYIERLYEEWSGSMSADLQDSNTATITCTTPFALGLLVGHIMNRWLRDGQGFDTLLINTKENKATISVCKDANKNRLKLLWE